MYIKLSSLVKYPQHQIFFFYLIHVQTFKCKIEWPAKYFNNCDASNWKEIVIYNIINNSSCIDKVQAYTLLEYIPIYFSRKTKTSTPICTGYFYLHQERIAIFDKHCTESWVTECYNWLCPETWYQCVKQWIPQECCQQFHMFHFQISH